MTTLINIRISDPAPILFKTDTQLMYSIDPENPIKKKSGNTVNAKKGNIVTKRNRLRCIGAKYWTYGDPSSGHIPMTVWELSPN
jgi:hypothetical protein